MIVPESVWPLSGKVNEIGKPPRVAFGSSLLGISELPFEIAEESFTMGGADRLELSAGEITAGDITWAAVGTVAGALGPPVELAS